jgi:hypothetical protein
MTDENQQLIVDDVCEVWTLTGRDDLLADCITFVEDNMIDFNVFEIKDLVIEFLLTKCADAMSTADLNAMAKDFEDQDREAITKYEEIRGV